MSTMREDTQEELEEMIDEVKTYMDGYLAEIKAGLVTQERALDINDGLERVISNLVMPLDLDL